MAQPPQEPAPQWRRFAKISTNSKQLRRRARKIESATVRHAHRFIVRRWDNAREVRRHIIAWLVLVVLLIGATVLQAGWYVNSYTTEAPVEGATYAEGVIDKLDTINPLFASTDSEQSASRLVFSSLLSYDRKNHLKGDLAATWEAREGGEAYRVTLKEGLRWHDGTPLTADDVLFTIELMRNPSVLADAELQRTWTQVDAQKIDEKTIEFTSPGKFSPFLHALTFGVVPKHILGKTPPERIRESEFGRNPIGSGPFKFQDIQIINPDENRVVVQFEANKKYHGGAPRLSRFQLHTYMDGEQLKQGFLSGEINAAIGLSSNELIEVERARPLAQKSQAGLYNGTFAFFNTQSTMLRGSDVRRALTMATNRTDIIKALGGNALPLDGPLLRSQYDSAGVKGQLAPSRAEAGKVLDRAGWKLGKDGIRYKGQTPLRISVLAPRDGDYADIAEELTAQWRKIGVDVKTELMKSDTFIQNVIRPRAYDVLIYEIELGVDPDSYAYWHSSQTGMNGRNLSNYDSPLVDEVLQSARTVTGEGLRDAKYRAFVQQWAKDAPAVALFRPTIHYISTGNSISVPAQGDLSSNVGRFRAVEYWSVSRDVVMETP